MNTANNTKIFRNAAILFIGMAVTKLISAMLKIPLTNILGGLGMGYFSTAYSLFSPVYAVTAAALPTVITRLVAKNAAKKQFKNVRRIRKAGIFAAFSLGLAGTSCIFIIAKPFATYVVGEPSALPSMLVIAPALFLGGIGTAYRGYYEGLSNMLPTAISQIIEAAVKSSVGIALAVWLMPYGIAYAAAGAIAGITFGELFGLLFLFLRSKMKDSITAQMFSAAPAPQRKRVIIAQIMRDSIPFTIAAAAMNINPFIDMLTIPTNTDQFTYGSYTGIALPIFTIATGVTAMLGKSAFPEITAAYENGDNRRMLRAVRILFKSALMAGLPVCIGLAALSQPLLSLLYFSRPQEVAVSAVPLSILGAGGIFLIISGMLFSIFMAAGRVDLQIKLMLTGSVVKLVLNLLLIPNENTGVSGAAISTIAAYAVVSIIGLILLKPTLRLTRENSEKIGIPRFIFQPLIFAILCGITAEICHNDIFADIDRPAALTLAMSVAAGAVVYLTLTMFSDRKYIKTLIHSIKTRKNPPLA